LALRDTLRGRSISVAHGATRTPQHILLALRHQFFGYAAWIGPSHPCDILADAADVMDSVGPAT
jgi:hypothetical protein